MPTPSNSLYGGPRRPTTPFRNVNNHQESPRTPAKGTVPLKSPGYFRSRSDSHWAPVSDDPFTELRSPPNGVQHIPSIDPASGRITEFPMDTHSLRAVLALLDWDGDHVPDKNDRSRFGRSWRFANCLSEYILTPSEMAQTEFPMPSYLFSQVSDGQSVMDRSGGWVETPAASCDSQRDIRTVFALDCEMVICGSEHVIAQVCLVDWFTERIVYFKYVAPPVGREVTDYVTHKSGITPGILQGVTTTLQDVQQDLLAFLRNSNAVLIGHGVHTDLKVLKLSHSKIVDTSLIFNPPYGRKPGPTSLWQRPKLMDLVHTHLQQYGFQVGVHSPAVDALVCIELVKLKCAKGIEFGGEGYRGFLKNPERPLPCRPATPSTPSRGSLFKPPRSTKAVEIRSPSSRSVSDSPLARRTRKPLKNLDEDVFNDDHFKPHTNKKGRPPQLSLSKPPSSPRARLPRSALTPTSPTFNLASPVALVF